MRWNIQMGRVKNWARQQLAVLHNSFSHCPPYCIWTCFSPALAHYAGKLVFSHHPFCQTLPWNKNSIFSFMFWFKKAFYLYVLTSQNTFQSHVRVPYVCSRQINSRDFASPAEVILHEIEIATSISKRESLTTYNLVLPRKDLKWK